MKRKIVEGNWEAVYAPLGDESKTKPIYLKVIVGIAGAITGGAVGILFPL